MNSLLYWHIRIPFEELTDSYAAADLDQIDVRPSIPVLHKSFCTVPVFWPFPHVRHHILQSFSCSIQEALWMALSILQGNQ